jgi:Ca2+-binding RTX toxin-like protein
MNSERIAYSAVGRVYLDCDVPISLTHYSTETTGHVVGAVRRGGDMVNIVGTAEEDFIHRLGDFETPPGGSSEIATATTGADSIVAGAGDDTVHADGGDDTVRGGTGNDRLFGSYGTDQVFGDEGDDVIVAWAGNLAAGEKVSGGAGIDTFQTQGGDLTGVTLSGVEILSVAPNAGTLLLTSAQINSFGTIAGVPWHHNADVTLSAPGTANLTETAVLTILNLHGSVGGDVFRLPDDHDAPHSRIVIEGEGGNDTLIGGAGTDYGSGGDGNDMLAGSAGNDHLEGNGGSDALNGGEGNDALQGGNDADVLIGGNGNDSFLTYSTGEGIAGLAETINGGAGNDVLSFAFLGGKIDISQAVIRDVERLVFDNHRMILTPEQLGDFVGVTGGSPSKPVSELVLASGGTADLIGATITGVSAIRGSSGADIVNLTNVATPQTLDGRGGSDSVIGGLNGDTLAGYIGADTLDGGAGNDVLDGGAHADVLLGSAGSDWLNGGLGRDRLTGGASGDTFDFNAVNDSTPIFFDRILDFQSGEDRIDLGGIDASDAAAGDQAFAFIGADAFHGFAGELRYAGGVLSGDVDGDSSADFQVVLTGGAALAGIDLIL